MRLHWGNEAKWVAPGHCSQLVTTLMTAGVSTTVPSALFRETIALFNEVPIGLWSKQLTYGRFTLSHQNEFMTQKCYTVRLMLKPRGHVGGRSSVVPCPSIQSSRENLPIQRTVWDCSPALSPNSFCAFASWNGFLLP